MGRRASAPGFDCHRPGTNVTFYCADGAKAYWAERLTAATGAADDADNASRPAYARLRI